MAQQAAHQRAIQHTATVLGGRSGKSTTGQGRAKEPQEVELREEFKRFDTEGKGSISKADFVRVYRSEVTKEVLDSLLGRYNLVGENRLSFDEFCILILKISTQR